MEERPSLRNREPYVAIERRSNEAIIIRSCNYSFSSLCERGGRYIGVTFTAVAALWGLSTLISAPSTGKLPWIVMIELLAAFSLAVANGGNDIANAMGTSVGAGALSLKQALGFGSAFEFMGAILLGAMVSKTISKGVIEPREFEDNPGLFATVMFAVVSGASLTTLLATIYGYPISATHGIIGGLVAVGWASKGVNCVGWNALQMTMIMWVASPLAGLIASMLLQLLCEALLTLDLTAPSSSSSSSSSSSVSCIVVPMLWICTLTVTCLFMYLTGPEPIRINNAFDALLASVATGVILTIIRYVYIIIIIPSYYNSSSSRSSSSRIGGSTTTRFNQNRATTTTTTTTTTTSSRSSSSANSRNHKYYWSNKLVADGDATSCNSKKDHVDDDDDDNNKMTLAAAAAASSSSSSSYIWPRIWQWFCYNGGNGIRGNADDDGDGGDEEEERFHNIILKAAKRNYLTVPSSSSAITISSYKGGRHHNDHDDVSAAAANSDDYHHIRCYHQDNVKKSQIIKQQQQQQQQRKDVIITPLADHTGLLIDEEDDGYDVANDATTTTTSTISTSSSTTNTNCSCEGASKREIIMEITTTTIGSENEEEEEDEEDLKTPLQDHQAKIKNNNEEEFVSLLVLSALTVAFAHGANDVGNAVGPLAAMLEVLTDGVVHEVPTVPMWALVLGAVGFVVGILTLGQNTIDTVGNRITHLTPSKSYATQMGAAIAVLLSSSLGMPVSTSHCLVGSVIGVGVAQNISSTLKLRVNEAADINISIINKIVIGWLVTIPIAMCLSLVAFNIVRPFSDSFAAQL